MKRFKRLWNEDKGAALLFVAGSLVLLMGLAAMGTDLAWFYLNTSRVQRAADAAALAGVVWMPNEFGTATSTAQAIATQNGYADGVDNAVVTPASVPGEQNQLQVTIDDTVPTFFLKVLGFDTMGISRTAIAEYIPPLKLGSPDNQFGNACDPEYEGDPGFPSDCGDNFWANIHGWYTQTGFGDAYAAHCASGNDNSGCGANPTARDEGYLYGIESGSGFTVQFVDLAFHNISGGVSTADQHRTGDRGCEDWGSSASDCGPTMIVNLYAPDPTPLDLSDNGSPVCTATIPPEPQIEEVDGGGNGVPYSWEAPDSQSCWSQSGSGIWVVQVRHQDPGSTADRAGLNRYSARSTTGQMYALRDFSIYNNAQGSTTAFYLAEVPDYYAGKTFVVEMFDPGEFSGSGTGYLQIVDQDGNIFDDGECRLYSKPEGNPTAPWTHFDTISAGSDCQEPTTSGEYHNQWLKFEMDLPATYSCSTCWWQMNYVYPGSAPVQDTTTWRAYIVGNPIHLVGP